VEQIHTNPILGIFAATVGFFFGYFIVLTYGSYSIYKKRKAKALGRASSIWER